MLIEKQNALCNQLQLSLGVHLSMRWGILKINHADLDTLTKKDALITVWHSAVPPELPLRNTAQRVLCCKGLVHGIERVWNYTGQVNTPLRLDVMLSWLVNLFHIKVTVHMFGDGGTYKAWVCTNSWNPCNFKACRGMQGVQIVNPKNI